MIVLVSAQVGGAFLEDVVAAAVDLAMELEACAVLGAKYYPIPYRWGRLAGIFLVMGGIYALIRR